MKEGILYLYTSVRTYNGVSEGWREREGVVVDVTMSGKGGILYMHTHKLPHPDISAPPQQLTHMHRHA